MKKYKITNHFEDEYDVVIKKSEKEFNRLSREGWKFVSSVSQDKNYWFSIWEREVNPTKIRKG